MISFQKLYENMSSFEEKDRSLEAIKRGLNIREDFWDDFMNLLGNAEDLADLLDISAVKISGWHCKIKDGLKKVQEDNQPETEKRNLIHTGENDEESEAMA